MEADEESDPKTFIQQLSGKLGQSLRKYTDNLGEPDFDLEKFAVNSVISATHTAQMDSSDKEDIIKKVNSSGMGGDGEPSPEEPTGDTPEGGDAGFGDAEPSGEEVEFDVEEGVGEDYYNNDGFEDNEDYEKASREIEYGSVSEDIDGFEDYEKASREIEYGDFGVNEPMDLMTKYGPAFKKIADSVGENSNSYKRFYAAISNGDEDFANKILKDLGIVNENFKKNSDNSLFNSKKTPNFVKELRKKLKEHHDMDLNDFLKVDNQEYVNTETKPVETPTITPTETPTRTPRRDKPFKVPTISPGTEPRPKASN